MTPNNHENKPTNTITNQAPNTKQKTSTKSNKEKNNQVLSNNDKNSKNKSNQLLGKVKCRNCQKTQPDLEWYVVDLCNNVRCYLSEITKYISKWFFCEPCYDKDENRKFICYDCNSLKSRTEYLGEGTKPEIKEVKIIGTFSDDPFS